MGNDIVERLMGNDIAKAHGPLPIHFREVLLQQAWPESFESLQTLSNGKKLQANTIESITSLFAVKE